MDISPVISSFWHGSSLTFFEQLCLKSFVDHGHKVKLYSLNEITNTPPGVENADARIFLPDHLKIWRNEKRNSAYAPLSDFFRINMLRESDEIWMDCDMLCMQPIPDIPYIFAKEKRYFNNAALRLPHSSPTLQGMHDFMNGSEIVIPNDWPWKKILMFPSASPMKTALSRYRWKTCRSCHFIRSGLRLSRIFWAKTVKLNTPCHPSHSIPKNLRPCA